MQNIAIILTLLLVPYWLLIPAHLSEPLRGRIGVSLVFAFTAVGHFIKTAEMTQMLPAWVPMRLPLILSQRGIRATGGDRHSHYSPRSAGRPGADFLSGVPGCSHSGGHTVLLSTWL
jgi:hypothetical protein